MQNEECSNKKGEVEGPMLFKNVNVVRNKEGNCSRLKEPKATWPLNAKLDPRLDLTAEDTIKDIIKPTNTTGIQIID